MRPIRWVTDETVFGRVEVDIVVVEVHGEVVIVTDRGLLIAALPNPSFAAAGHHRGARFRTGQGFDKRELDRAPATGKVGVAFGQGPQAVHVAGKDRPGIAMKRCERTHLADRGPQPALVTKRPERQSSRSTVKKNVPPGTRLR